MASAVGNGYNACCVLCLESTDTSKTARVEAAPPCLDGSSRNSPILLEQVYYGIYKRLERHSDTATTNYYSLTIVGKENNIKSTFEKNYSSALSQFLLMALYQREKTDSI
jgi:hypothetical protein